MSLGRVCSRFRQTVHRQYVESACLATVSVQGRAVYTSYTPREMQRLSTGQIQDTAQIQEHPAMSAKIQAHGEMYIMYPGSYR